MSGVHLAAPPLGKSRAAGKRVYSRWRSHMDYLPLCGKMHPLMAGYKRNALLWAD